MKKTFLLLLLLAAISAFGDNCPSNQFVTSYTTAPNTNCPNPPCGSPIGCAQPTTANLAGFLTASASLDFADPAANTCAAALTITLAGAAVGDPVMLGVPSTITVQASQFFPVPIVTAANTVTIKFCEGATVTNNPAAGTFKVTVIK